MNEIFDIDSRLVVDEGVFNVRLYDKSLTAFDSKTAYLKDDYYYLYRGDLTTMNRNDKPGIYYDAKSDRYVLFEVEEKDKDHYTWEGKVGTLNPDRIIEMINNNQIVIINDLSPEGANILPISESDDILKRVMKKAIFAKQSNIDLYKNRFIDKNAFFNFKQVMNGDGKLSILLFDRGIDALNLKYTIIVEEAEPDKLIIGMPLEEPVIVSTEDTYNI